MKPESQSRSPSPRPAAQARSRRSRPHPSPVAETGEAFATPPGGGGCDRPRRGTIRIAPGRYGECAIQEAGRVAYVAQRRGEAVFDGGACEGKATLVLRGKAARVDGLVFTRVRVPDGNGAGIRLQDGDLDVSYSLFSDGESGILTHNGPPGSVGSTVRPSPGSARATGSTASMSAITAASASPTPGSSAAGAAITSRAGRRASRCWTTASTTAAAAGPTI